jgi:diguanylate cyclase (GGDEF)-like protein
MLGARITERLERWRSISSPVRPAGRTGRRLRFGFAPRLAISVGLTLALVAGLGYAVATGYLKRHVIGHEQVYHRGQAAALEAIARGRDPRAARPLINRLIHVAAQREGIVAVNLIDSHYKVMGVSERGTFASLEADRRIEAAIERGTSSAGPEVDTHGERDFEFVTPVDLPGGRFAFETEYEQGFFDEELGHLRNYVALIALLGMLGGCAAFYVLGGRSLLQSHRRARRRATLDGLTDLGNQRAFHDELHRAVAVAERTGEPLALALMDIDDFRFLNERHGHAHGDELLLRVAGALRQARASDRAFRVGGDEFALILSSTGAAGARHALRRLQDALAESHVTVSVGVSVLQRGTGAETLRAEADAALFEAKPRGGGALLLFEEVSDAVSITTGAKIEALHRLLADRDLTVAFQPIWDLERGSLVGVEALARPAEKYGFSGPAEAFDIAEQIGRVHELDMMCVAKVLPHVEDLPDGALLFVNIAPRTLDFDAQSDGWLLSAVGRSGIEPERVVIEVTERFGARMSSVLKSLQRLTDAGLKLALDDVGAGNSGLEMLRRLDVDYVKIDRSVVTGAMSERGARAVLVSMATFANETGSYVIAEGIEDQEVLHFVRELADDLTIARPHIHGGQGYGLGRPSSSMPPTHNDAVLAGSHNGVPDYVPLLTA